MKTIFAVITDTTRSIIRAGGRGYAAQLPLSCNSTQKREPDSDGRGVALLAITWGALKTIAARMRRDAHSTNSTAGLSTWLVPIH